MQSTCVLQVSIERKFRKSLWNVIFHTRLVSALIRILIIAGDQVLVFWITRTRRLESKWFFFFCSRSSRHEFADSWINTQKKTSTVSSRSLSLIFSPLTNLCWLSMSVSRVSAGSMWKIARKKILVRSTIEIPLREKTRRKTNANREEKRKKSRFESNDLTF